jgi:hypothetical protein
MAEFNYACQQCPRTFKLQEFYEKHMKVHVLKKQHVCRLCGYVYGAAKGLEGHIETAHGGQETAVATIEAGRNLLLLHQPAAPTASRPLTTAAGNNSGLLSTPPKHHQHHHQHHLSPPPEQLPFGLGFHFLQSANKNASSLLAAAAADQAKLAQDSASLLQKAHQAMLVAQMKSVASRSVLSLSVASPSPPPPSASPPQPAAAPGAHLQQDKSKIPSPAGTGNYRIYGECISLILPGKFRV